MRPRVSSLVVFAPFLSNNSTASTLSTTTRGAAGGVNFNLTDILRVVLHKHVDCLLLDAPGHAILKDLFGVRSTMRSEKLLKCPPRDRQAAFNKKVRTPRGTVGFSDCVIDSEAVLTPRPEER